MPTLVKMGYRGRGSGPTLGTAGKGLGESSARRGVWREFVEERGLGEGALRGGAREWGRANGCNEVRGRATGLLVRVQCGKRQRNGASAARDGLKTDGQSCL